MAKLKGRPETGSDAAGLPWVGLSALAQSRLIEVGQPYLKPESLPSRPP